MGPWMLPSELRAGMRREVSQIAAGTPWAGQDGGAVWGASSVREASRER